MEPLILIAEDEKTIRGFLKLSLETQGYKCIDTDNGKTALMASISQNPDILLLDLGLPDMDGLEVIKRIRMVSTVPIIVISARGHEREKVEVLDAGADDYITKPFGVPELLARIRVVLRHKQPLFVKGTDNQVFIIKDLKIDTASHRVWLENTEIKLTPHEYKVLVLLGENQGKVITHKQILEKVWGSLISEDDIRSLRVCMGNLRRKLKENPSEPKYIITEIGVGYRLAD